MNLNVCTWFCADELGEESVYKQMRGKSSSKTFQAVYWRNIYIFFTSSMKFNLNAKHILFLNTPPPIIDGLDIGVILKDIGVEIIIIDFSYRTPKNYYSSWRNQFFEFSIFDFITDNYDNDDYWLLLDSDCVFTRSVENLPDLAKSHEDILTYVLTEKPGTVINGLSQDDMRAVYSELLGREVNFLPSYHAGEFFFANTKWVRRLSLEFKNLWLELLSRFSSNQLVLTEEAHVLSYLYFKFGVDSTGTANNVIKRLWTQPFIYRNVDEGDEHYPIWHVPHEKRYGLDSLFKLMIKKPIAYWLNMPEKKFVDTVGYYLTIPSIPPLIYLFRIVPVQFVRIIYYTVRRGTK